MTKVTCLCVSRGIQDHLDVAVACWRYQTIPCRLVVAHEGNVDESRYTPLIHWVRVDKGTPLGDIRNATLRAVNTEYWIQWDDDDWHAPNRVEAQLAHAQENGLQVCLLRGWTIYDQQTGMAHTSKLRAHEGSILCRRDAHSPAPYQPLRKGEDTKFMETTFGSEFVPGTIYGTSLYVYRFHGRNAFGHEHFLKLQREQIDAAPIAARFSTPNPSLYSPQPEDIVTLATEVVEAPIDRVIKAGSKLAEISRQHYRPALMRIGKWLARL